MDITHTGVPLCSPSLKRLSLEGVSGCQMARYPQLGDLPQLEKLQLKFLPGLEVTCPPMLSAKRFIRACKFVGFKRLHEQFWWPTAAYRERQRGIYLEAVMTLSMVVCTGPAERGATTSDGGAS